MKNLKPYVIFAALYCAAAFVCFAPGCAALDQAAPAFAPKPATTQPDGTTRPAVPRDVVGEVATVVHAATTNPVVQGPVDAVPYGSIILGGLGLITSVILASKNGGKAGLLNTLATAHGTDDHATAVAQAVTLAQGIASAAGANASVKAAIDQLPAVATIVQNVAAASATPTK